MHFLLHRDLLEQIAKESYVTKRIRLAIDLVDRKHYLPKDQHVYAYYDIPLPIGHSQTCAQPTVIAFMLALLDIKPNNKVLEIGTGCGYHAAITSQLLFPGKLTSIEFIPELAAVATDNLSQEFTDLDQRIALLEGDGSSGVPVSAPFERIYSTAGVNYKTFNPSILIRQLSENGILVYPTTQGPLAKVEKIYGLPVTSYFGSFNFVPMVGENK